MTAVSIFPHQPGRSPFGYAGDPLEHRFDLCKARLSLSLLEPSANEPPNFVRPVDLLPVLRHLLLDAFLHFDAYYRHGKLGDMTS